MNNDFDEPIPKVWEMFLRLISDSDKEYKFLFKIISSQIVRIISNMKEIYEQDIIKKEELPIIREIHEQEMVGRAIASDPRTRRTKKKTTSRRNHSRNRRANSSLSSTSLNLHFLKNPKKTLSKKKS